MDIKNRDWNVKAQVTPNIPRSDTDTGYINSLKTILLAIEKNTEKQTIIKIEGSETNHTLEDLAIRLRPAGIVFQYHTQGKWHINEEFKYWKHENNEMFIAGYLQSKIKYMSEMLGFILEPKGVSEILEHANNIFNIPWKNNSEIYNRLHWFMDLGMVKHINYERKYTLTPLGKKFIKESIPTEPETIKSYTYDSTVDEIEVTLDDWLQSLYKFDWVDYSKRKNSIGYIPGGIKTSVDTILEVLGISNDTLDFDTIFEYLHSTLKVKKSSISGFTSFLYNLKLLERKGETIYRVTDLGRKLLHSENPNFDFIFILHSKYRYILEMLYQLKKQDKTIHELAAIGVTKFGMETDKVEQIRRRVGFLKNANLIIEESARKLSLTNRGILLLEKFTNQINKLTKVSQSSNTNEIHQSNTHDLLQKARLASVDSANPHNFEKILNLIFRHIGFDSELLGKSGTTDILLTAPTAPKFAYNVAIDAKTNKDGVITEGLIDFETLKEHREKHGVDYLIVVGKTFSKNRLVKRAKNNNIVLLDIDSLETLVKHHQKYPLQAIEYEIIFKYPGLVNINLLDEIYFKMERNKVLFKLIIDTLIINSDDEFTGGILSTREIYMFIKDNDIFKNESLEKEEIENMLGLLSNPLINCVGFTKDGYYAKGSLDDAALKFGFYFNISSN